MIPGAFDELLTALAGADGGGAFDGGGGAVDADEGAGRELADGDEGPDGIGAQLLEVAGLTEQFVNGEVIVADVKLILAGKFGGDPGVEGFDKVGALLAGMLFVEADGGAGEWAAGEPASAVGGQALAQFSGGDGMAEGRMMALEGL